MTKNSKINTISIVDSFDFMDTNFQRLKKNCIH